jgi:predicted dehydrogenase
MAAMTAIGQRLLRGALIGCGYFARYHLEAWARVAGVKIVASADPLIERARRAAPRAYEDATVMLERERLDFVDIATRPNGRLGLIGLCAAKGVAVVCQKPVAVDWTGALAVAEFVRGSGMRFMVHENWRWQAWYRECRRLIHQGAIGSPITYSMRFRRSDGAGPEPYQSQPYLRQMPRFLIYEILVHHLDTSRFLFGPVNRVFARTARMNPAIRGEDRALVLVEHANGVDGIIDGHHAYDESEPGQTSGDAWFEGDEGRLVLDGAGHLHLGGRQVWTNPGVGYRGDSVFNAFVHFAARLRDGLPFETGIDEYLPSIAAMEAAYSSAERGCAVDPAEFLTGPLNPEHDSATFGDADARDD